VRGGDRRSRQLLGTHDAVDARIEGQPGQHGRIDLRQIARDLDQARTAAGVTTSDPEQPIDDATTITRREAAERGHVGVKVELLTVAEVQS